jgi:hypothetical protein
MAINIIKTAFDIKADTSLAEDGLIYITCNPVDVAITEYLARVVVRNMTRFTTIYTEQFNNLSPGLTITVSIRPEDLIKNSNFNIIVQVKATQNDGGEEIIQRDFFVHTLDYFTSANIKTNNFAIRYNKVRNSYFITGEAVLAYSGYESFRILCTIRDALNTLLFEKYLNYIIDPNNIRRVVINQDLGAFGFPATWNLRNPCAVRLSYEYI